MSAWGGSARSCDALLARVEANDPSLEELVVLPTKRFGAAEIDRISAAIGSGQNKHLKSLSASGHALPPNSFASFGSALAKGKSALVRLAIGDKSMGDEGVVAFCSALEDAKGGKLESLDLEWKNISKEGLVAVGQAFGESKYLKELNLSRNEQIDNNAILEFCKCSLPVDGKAAFTELELLNLSECSFGSDALQFMAQALFADNNGGFVAAEHNSRLTLLLDRNSLAAEVSFFFRAMMCCQRPVLKSLSMSGCKIVDEGIMDMCEAVSESSNQKLQSLNLSNNTISKIGAERLARSLWSQSKTDWSHLEELSLAGNPLTQDGVVSIAKSLAHRSSEGEEVDGNQVLKSLDITNTTSGVDGAVAIVRCTSLSSLRLFNNELSSTGFEALAEVLRGGHPSIVNLDLGGNRASQGSVVLLLNALADSGHVSAESRLRVLEIGGNEAGPQVENAIKSLQKVHPELDVARDRPKQGSRPE